MNLDVFGMFSRSDCMAYDDAFFNRNWAGVCRGRWVGPGLLAGWDAGFLNCLGRGRLAAESSNQDMTATTLIGLLWVWHSSAMTTKMGDRRGLHPWPLRCLSQFLSERKERLLRIGVATSEALADPPS